MMKIEKLTGQIELLSGLHIGGGDDTMKIGGIDNGVIKDINTDKPYIPGSSLKGKMRSLLEWHIGVVGVGDGTPFSSKLLDNPIFNDEKIKVDATNLLKLFGDKEGKYGITRISVGDCSLSKDSQEMELSEAKYENVINRQEGTAEHPRQTERVPAGVKFDYDIRVKILDEDNKLELLEMIKKGFELIENDYLGGSGSRGYGRVSFISK
ncbi:MAG: type III-A CRISPR-associated RAMP protein Csm3 [Sulfurimonas sp.]